MRRCNNYHGSILLTLLFLIILISSIIVALDADFLAKKLDFYWQQHAVVFAAAESGLKIAEAKINNQSISLPKSDVLLDFKIFSPIIDQCGGLIYLILVTASYHEVKIDLLSRYRKTIPPILPGCPSSSHRIGWRQQY